MASSIPSFDGSSVGSETTLLNGSPTYHHDAGSRGLTLPVKKVAWADLSAGSSLSNPIEIDLDDASVASASTGISSIASGATLPISNVSRPGPKVSVIGHRKRVTWRDLPVGNPRAWQLPPKKASSSASKRKIEKTCNDYIEHLVRVMGHPDSWPTELKKSVADRLKGKIWLARKCTGRSSVHIPMHSEKANKRTGRVRLLPPGRPSDSLLFDTGASRTVTGNPADFVPGSLKPLPPSRSVRGVGGNLPVTHVGLACFAFRDDNNHVQIIQTKGYLVKGCNEPLLSPQTYMKELKKKDFWGKMAMMTTANALIFRWPKGNTVTLPLHSIEQRPLARLLPIRYGVGASKK